MRRRDVVQGLVATVLCGLRSSEARPRRLPGLILFTPQEAKRLRLSDEEWSPSLQPPSSIRPRSLTLGPRIVVQRPSVRDTPEGPTLETATPMGLLIVFEPRGAAVDMQSLRVQARKGMFSKSLTKLLQPYIHETRVEAQDVQVPAGRFLIQLEIADLQGRQTVEAYRLEVKNL